MLESKVKDEILEKRYSLNRTVVQEITFKSSVTGTGDRDQMCVFYYVILSTVAGDQKWA